jgi:hypothetical protein
MEACNADRAASRARQWLQWLHILRLTLPRDTRCRPSMYAGAHVVLKGNNYHFKASSSLRSPMLRRLLDFPADRPASSLDVPRAALEAWEAGACTADMSDEGAVAVIKVSALWQLR